MDGRVSSGSIFSKLNLTKFDKIKFQKSWHQTLMLTQSRWERSIIPWKTRYFSFFFTPKDAWQSFYLIETWKFLEFTQGSLQERSSLLLSPISSIRPQAKLAPRSAMRGRTLTRPLSNVRDFTFYREYVRSCLPQHNPTDPAPGMTRISQQAPIFFHPFSISHLAPPPSKIWVGNSV